MLYEVLRYNVLDNLQETVNNYIQLGWKPQGGITADGNLYYQAMIMHTEETTNA